MGTQADCSEDGKAGGGGGLGRPQLTGGRSTRYGRILILFLGWRRGGPHQGRMAGTQGIPTVQPWATGGIAPAVVPLLRGKADGGPATQGTAETGGTEGGGQRKRGLPGPSSQLSSGIPTPVPQQGRFLKDPPVGVLGAGWKKFAGWTPSDWTRRITKKNRQKSQTISTPSPPKFDCPNFVSTRLPHPTWGPDLVGNCCLEKKKLC